MKRWMTFVVFVSIVALSWWVMQSPVCSSRPTEVRLPSVKPEITPKATPAETQYSRPAPAADTASVAALQTPVSPPKYLAALLTNGNADVSGEALRRQPLAAEHLQQLLARYREIKSVTNKLSIARALAASGGDEVADLFFNTVTRDYQGREVTMSEGMQLGYLIVLLGQVARRSERAFDILRQGTAPEFWRVRITWRTPLPDESSQILVKACIRGLAHVDRDEAWAHVLNLASNAPAAYLRTFAATFLDAAHVHDELVSRRSASNRGGRSLTEYLEDFKKWITTPTGQQWYAWYDRHTQPAPSQGSP